MSKSSIYESAWLDLVFEGKNKAYGAYRLRQESPKTTMYAFALGLFFVASVVSIGLFLSAFGNKPSMNETPLLTDSIRLTRVNNPEPLLPPPTPVSQPKKAASPESDVREMTNNPQIVTPEDAHDVRHNDDPPAGPQVPETPDGIAGSSVPSAPSAPSIAPLPAPDGPVSLTALDRMPEFPGGIGSFYKYVGDNFEKPEIDQTVTVLLSFVIEKDGTMTDIKVLRNPGYGLDKEAIRVLKSLKTKWKPGLKNGQSVRVLYQLPIRVTQN